MAKVVSNTTTHAATKAANKKPMKDTKEPKEKRPPSAYNVFVKEKMAELKAKPDFVMKEAMKIIAGMWKEDPANPNKGKVVVPRKKKTKDASESVSKKENSKPKLAKKKFLASSSPVPETSEFEEGSSEAW